MTQRSRVTGRGSPARRREIEKFLDLFTGVENCLKAKLGLPSGDRTAVSTLIDKYLEWNPYWSDQAQQLRLLKEIRNLLVHNRSDADGYPVLLPLHTVQRLEAIHEHLKSPVTIGAHFRRSVVKVTPDDTLRSILTLAYDRGFSQFPVISDGRFAGLITEHAVFRWLGKLASTASAVDLDQVRVRRVMKEQEPDRRRSILAFDRVDAPEDEVMGRFATSPLLEVVLLTEDGRSASELMGIITQWDAARYPS